MSVECGPGHSALARSHVPVNRGQGAGFTWVIEIALAFLDRSEASIKRCEKSSTK